MIRVLIVDDHEMIRNGLASLLRGEPDINVVEFAKDGQDAIDKLAYRSVDVVLMDVMMPVMNGVDATREIKLKYPKLKVLAVTINDEPRFIKEALAAGASGYLLKHSTKDEIVKAIKDVHADRQHFSHDVLAKISDEFTKGKGIVKPVLTKKEAVVLKLIIQEYTNQEIADSIDCGMRTVDTHKRNLIKKLGVKNVVGLVKYAIRTGIVKD